jgi:hypothetical protein
MEPLKLHFIRTHELAELAGVHGNVITGLLLRRVINCDHWLKAGPALHPIFLSSRKEELLAAIKAYQASMKNAAIA